MKLFNQARRYGSRLAMLGAATVLPLVASATPPPGDYDAITSAVDFAAVGIAIAAIGALFASPLVIKKGTKMVLSMLR